MKNLILFFILTSTFFACTKVDENWLVNQNSTTIIDSSKTIIGGDTNIFHISFNPVINTTFVDSSKNYFAINVAGSTFYVTVHDSVTVNNNLSNIVTVQGDSIFINNNNVNQASCPYDKDHCIIANCWWHHRWRFYHYHC